MEIILGTYEEYLLGYKPFLKSKELKQTFSTHSHSGSIRALCASNIYLASGGADDRIFVYDLKHRKEQCILTHHNATVNCLAFTPEHTHLISGSSDGVLAIVRVGNWQLEKIWDKAHKGSAVLDIAVHSSGKLALTLGADHSLATWNLVKGRLAYMTNLNSKSKDPKSLERVIWAPCGVRFILFGGKYMEIWSIKQGGLLNVIEHDSKITCCAWLSEDSLLMGYETGKICIVDIDSGKIRLHDAHTNRIKAVACYEEYVISITSIGEITIWDKRMNQKCSGNTGCRNICLCVIPSKDIKEDLPKDDILDTIVVKKLNPKPKRGIVIIEEEKEEPEQMQHKKKKKNKLKTRL